MDSGKSLYGRNRFFFTVNYGQFPLIGLLLALTFGVYGAIKKKGGYPAVEAITFESTVMVLPAVVMLLVLARVTGSHAFLGSFTFDGVKTSLLLIGAGIATAVPLILFARAANLIPLTILGFIQFLSPTISLLIGVFVNHEPFTLAHAVCFGCIWGGLALVSVDSLFASRRSRSR